MEEIAAKYRRFAEEEARGRSPLYEELALGVAGDEEVLAFLATLPAEKRQPNLLLAVVRFLYGTPEGWAEFRRELMQNLEAVRRELMMRATQTNEPTRCATLLPILAKLPQPLALIEVGASAGLCLLPDYYSYVYGERVLRPLYENAEAPVFSCDLHGAQTPVEVPHITWRAGLDVNPIDVSVSEQAAWLETLVWPEQMERLARLRAAIRVAAAIRPRLIAGDLRNDLAALCAEAPEEATLVIFHTAVLAYVSAQAEREAFAEQAKSLCHYWVANESPRVFPEIAKLAAPSRVPGRFLLSVNGAPMAWTDPHGAAFEWIDERVL